MATTQKRLVNKQFNSPIGLYSEDNIRETLDRELKQLRCGAIGIDFDDPTTTKPGALAKSAVLQALEEEERQARGLKRVAWPPQETENHEENATIHEALQQQYNPPAQLEFSKPVAETQEHIIPIQRTGPAVFLNGGGTHTPVPPVVIYHKPAQISSPQNQTNTTQYITSPSSISPSTNTADSNLFVWQHVPSPAPKPAKIFTHDTTYVPPPFRLDLNPQFVDYNEQHHQPYYQTQPQHQPQTQAIPTPSYVSVSKPLPHHQTCPGLVTIRQEPPVTQQPAPVYTSQPVAAIYQGGSNMPGDEKWPPVAYKQQSEVDNDVRKKLAAQPVFRPRRPQKDYTEFFAKNQLNSTYPGYRPPPGTQHHGTSM